MSKSSISQELNEYFSSDEYKRKESAVNVDVSGKPVIVRGPQDRDERKVLILAGNAREANFHARKNGWTNWEFISSPSNLYGNKDGVRIAKVGTWFYRQDLRRLIEIIDDFVKKERAEMIKVKED